MSSLMVLLGTKVLLFTALATLISAIPEDYSTDNPEAPSTYEHYQISNGFLDGLPSTNRHRRAPWAPSVARSESYFRKVMDLVGRGKGKREKRTLPSYLQLDEMPLQDTPINRQRYHEERRRGERGMEDLATSSDGQGHFGQNYYDDDNDDFLVPIGGDVSPVVLERWHHLEPTDGEDQSYVQLVSDPNLSEGKRGGSPMYIGFGQHAASAALNAFQNILDEQKNYRHERPQNPVRFLGKR